MPLWFLATSSLTNNFLDQKTNQQIIYVTGEKYRYEVDVTIKKKKSAKCNVVGFHIGSWNKRRI